MSIDEQLKIIEEKLKYVFQNINEWLKFSEAKNVALIALNGSALFGIVSMKKDGLIFAEYLFILIAALFSCSIVLSILSFIPKTKMPFLFGSKSKSNSDNVYFYTEITKYNKNEYFDFLWESVFNQPSPVIKDFPPKHLTDLSNQIVVNSGIALNKFRFFNGAAILCLSGFISVAMNLLFYTSLLPQKEECPKPICVVNSK